MIIIVCVNVQQISASTLTFSYFLNLKKILQKKLPDHKKSLNHKRQGNRKNIFIFFKFISHISIRCMPSSDIYTFLTPVWHTQDHPINGVLRDCVPFLNQSLAELCNIPWRLLSFTNTSPKQVPTMFYGIQVRRHCRPIKNFDILIFKERHRDTSGMRTGIILHKDEPITKCSCKRPDNQAIFVFYSVLEFSPHWILPPHWKKTNILKM